MTLTFVHPAVGKSLTKKYLRAWQMEPLPVAQLMGMTPSWVNKKFYDDRIEEINFDDPTDFVAISVETYTAKRAYQIANEYRKRNIPVIMGGFHAHLCTEEVMQHAESVVIGEAENVWERVLEDFKQGDLKPIYHGKPNGIKERVMPDRSLFEGKNYLKINLLETSRGCRFKCEFCSVHNYFEGHYSTRSPEEVIKEIKLIRHKPGIFFFVDDNIIGNHKYATELFKALIPLKIKWVGQVDITIAKDDNLLRLMKKSGCQAVLIGFESLHPESLKKMNKGFGYTGKKLESAVRKVQKTGIRIYATFLFGYGHDEPNDFKRVVDFCINTKVFMVGFNHLTPFPGTELYLRLQKENRLLYDKWWLDSKYRYGQIPFRTEISHEQIESYSRAIRKKFYGIASIIYRMSNWTNINSLTMFTLYLTINFMLRADRSLRMEFPLGDVNYNEEMLTPKSYAHS